MKKIVLPCLLLLSQLSQAQNQQPILSNVSFQLSGNNTMVVNYDLEDAENDPITISFRAGKLGANDLNYITDNATGDIGAGILPGAGRQIQWDFSAYAAQATDEFRLMLVADDLQPVDIQSLVDQVDSLNLFEKLEAVEGVRHRTAGATQLQQVKDLIELEFVNNGLHTYFQEFPFGSYTGQNIIGQQLGTESGGQTYILDGHYDTVDDAPGADDNGSAVVGVLEAMRILSKYPTKKTIKYIGFDLEESGLIGSERYVQNGGIEADETIQGVINFEMIGYYTEVPNSQSLPLGFNLLFPDAYNEVASQEFRGNFITNVGKVGGSSGLMQAYKTAANAYVPALRVINVEAPITPPVPDLSRSDHAPFWAAGIPAVMLTDGADFRNPNYHTPNDVIGTLNFSFMSNVVKGAVATLAELAEVQHADIWWMDTDLFTPTQEKFDCKLAFSPNPTRRLLKIDWQGCDASQLAIAILDTKGRTVLSQTSVNQQTELDLSHLPSGLYFAKVKNTQGHVIEKIFVE